MDVSDLNFDLPQALIAQHPPKVRGGSRLLAVLSGMPLQDATFSDLPDYIGVGGVLVFNNTKAMKARLFGQKKSGGKIEALVERALDGYTALAHVRSSKSPKAGTVLIFEDGIRAVMIECVGDLFCLRFDYGQTVYELLKQNGRLPLSPYIERATDDDDDSRYQTVYAKYQGAVAAPTAGLYFTGEFLGRLEAKGVETAEVTLRVGAGTFQPVHVSNIVDHKMHSEWLDVLPETMAAIEAAQARGGRVQAVGTISMWALESAAQETGRLKAGQGDTDIFTTPDYRFNVTDRLIINLHLPKSALLTLVAAFSGMEHTRAVYRHAVKHEYRFFSYGDAMLLGRAGK